MKKRNLVITVLITVLALSATARTRQFPVPTLRKGSLMQMQKQMIEDMIVILERCNGSATRSAAELNRYYFKNRMQIAVMQKEMEKQQQILQKDPAKAAEYMRAYMPLLKRTMYLGKLMQKFMNDPAFAAAMKKMKLQMTGQ